VTVTLFDTPEWFGSVMRRSAVNLHAITRYG
jgi:hypothetical protein